MFNLNLIKLYANSHYITPRPTIEQAILEIKKDKIKLMTDDPAATIDVPHFCNEQGHQILESFKENGYDLFIIESSTSIPAKFSSS